MLGNFGVEMLVRLGGSSEGPQDRLGMSPSHCSHSLISARVVARAAGSTIPDPNFYPPFLRQVLSHTQHSDVERKSSVSSSRGCPNQGFPGGVRRHATCTLARNSFAERTLYGRSAEHQRGFVSVKKSANKRNGIGPIVFPVPPGCS